ncbi:hypothetical protein [Luteimonas sp. FCS-9]|nr:hypothetical protein [Luteimonas sp. FCS-9]
MNRRRLRDLGLAAVVATALAVALARAFEAWLSAPILLALLDGPFLCR